MSNFGSRQELIDTFIEWNTQINLSAIREPQAIYEKHILDSLELNKALQLADSKTPEGAAGVENECIKTLLDVGTGGGFPLLPLAISNPGLQCTGLDTRQKKCKAVQAIADRLGLRNVTTVRSRAEEHKKKYDYVTARAVGHASKLLPRTAHLVKQGGYLCLYKQYTEEEDTRILTHLDQFKLKLHKLHHYHITQQDEVERVLYILQKL